LNLYREVKTENKPKSVVLTHIYRKKKEDPMQLNGEDVVVRNLGSRKRAHYSKERYARRRPVAKKKGQQ